MPDFYGASGTPGNKAALSSAAIRAEFSAIAAGFAKLAPYTGHANEILTVNSGASGYTSASLSSLLAALSGSYSVGGNPTVTGNLTVNGNTVLGDAATDTLNVGSGGFQKNASNEFGFNCTPVTGVAVRVQNVGANDAGIELIRVAADQFQLISYNRLGAAYTKLSQRSSLFTWLNSSGARTLYLDDSSRLVIGAGSVGLGGSAICALSLDSGSTQTYTSHKASGGQETLHGADEFGGTFGTYTNYPVRLLSNNIERIRLMASGPVVVGATSNAGIGGGADLLAVAGSIGMSGGQFNANPGTSLSLEFVNRSSGGGLRFYTNAGGTIALDIGAGGDAAFNSGTVTARYLKAFTSGNGWAAVSPADTTHTGYCEFMAANGNRQGFIGYATTTGAGDGGTINFIMGTAAFAAAVTATSFAGDGASLTGLNASNLASGTVPDARFPATLPALSGVNLTSLNASNLGSGTVPNARISGAYSNITDLTTSGSTILGDVLGDTLNVANGAFKVFSDGRVSGNKLHNIGTVTGTTDQFIASGTYTPTLTNVTNIDSSVAAVCQWIRVGNVVHVSGNVQIDPTAAAATELGMSLPIASNFSSYIQLNGVGCDGTDAHAIGIVADPTNDRAKFDWVTANNFNGFYSFTFTYLVI